MKGGPVETGPPFFMPINNRENTHTKQAPGAFMVLARKWSSHLLVLKD